jgi:hypothetical protein
MPGLVGRCCCCCWRIDMMMSFRFVLFRVEVIVFSTLDVEGDGDGDIITTFYLATKGD